jgi:hypothetical protein
MTVAEAPTLPANCRTGIPPPPPWPPPPCEATLAPDPGVGFGLLDGVGFGATRRVPDPSSKLGLARVRFWSPGGLTSIGGN